MGVSVAGCVTCCGVARKATSRVVAGGRGFGEAVDGDLLRGRFEEVYRFLRSERSGTWE